MKEITEAIDVVFEPDTGPILLTAVMQIKVKDVNIFMRNTFKLMMMQVGTSCG